MLTKTAPLPVRGASYEPEVLFSEQSETRKTCRGEIIHMSFLTQPSSHYGNNSLDQVDSFGSDEFSTFYKHSDIVPSPKE